MNTRMLYARKKLPELLKQQGRSRLAMNANDSKRGDIEDLLPWHAAGTLGHRDTQRVEAALAGDHELARRYESVREELAQTIHLNETLARRVP